MARACSIVVVKVGEKQRGDMTLGRIESGRTPGFAINRDFFAQFLHGLIHQVTEDVHALAARFRVRFLVDARRPNRDFRLLGQQGIILRAASRRPASADRPSRRATAAG